MTPGETFIKEVIMTSIPKSDYIPRGNPAARMGLLAARLEKREYRPETVLTMDKAGWPGDWEGRTVLALVCLAETTKKEPAYLHEIVDTVLAARNERGYLGPIYEGMANEQQLAGHSWLLRGLCAYYGYTKRSDAYEAACDIGQNLFLPLRDLYPQYPVMPEQRVYGGEMAGNSAATVGKWIISTDTGCAYIPLDGLSALYEMTGDSRFGELLRIMIGEFRKIDFTGICMQTHATLTGIRGILRMYRLTGEQDFLSEAVRLFTLYCDHGMTANYANYNWFRRPEWTEPCAVVDSFLCAMQLYAATKARDYITLAQRIWYNAIGFGQRENGGFGCDSCLGADGAENHLILEQKCPEAYWCCTMRGGEGMAAYAKYAYLAEEDRITVPYFSPSDAVLNTANGTLRTSQKTDYPYGGNVHFIFTENRLTAPVTLSCYLPDTARDLAVCGAEYTVSEGMLHLRIAPDTAAVHLSFSLPYHTEPTVGKHNVKGGISAVFRGNLMYSVPTDTPLTLSASRLISSPAEYADLRPLYDACETDHAPRQVLFRA